MYFVIHRRPPSLSLRASSTLASSQGRRALAGLGSARMTAPAVVTELSVYPVKSCAGIAVHAAVVTETGFRFDRCWMLAEQRPPPPSSLSTAGGTRRDRRR